MVIELSLGGRMWSECWAVDHVRCWTQKRDLMLSLITKATLVFKDVVVDCVNDDYDASGP